MAAALAGKSPLVWEDVACPLCSARDESLFLTSRNAQEQVCFRLVRCGRCDLRYLNPRPTPETIGRFYTDDYHEYQKRPLKSKGLLARLRWSVLSAFYDYPPRMTGWLSRCLAALLYPWLAPAAGSHRSVPFTGQGRMLDYGCGSGWFAHGMRELGWDVTGMDFSDESAAHARRNYGLPVLVGTLPHEQVRPESFDVVNMGAVLEHVHRPHEVIGAAVRCLRPGGRLVVSVPNVEGWCIRNLGELAHTVQLPLHLLHFTSSTLRRLLEEHGLQIEQLRVLAKDSWLRHSFKAVRQSDAGRRLQWLAGLGLRRPVARWLTRWTSWTNRGDQLFAIARRREEIKRSDAAA